MSTTATEFNYVRQICVLARRLWAINIGMAPAQCELREFINNPRPGDLVIEQSSLGRRELNGNCASGIGRLLLTRKEFVNFKEEEGGYDDDFTYIETLDGRLERWSNCGFLRIPESLYDLAKEPDNSAWLAEALERHKDDFYAKEPQA